MDGKYCVIIPSLRRATVLHDTVLSVLRQNVLPERILLAVTSQEDTLPETRELPLCDVFCSPPGWVSQLNAAVDRLPSALEMVTIVDDDVELSEDYCSNALSLFRTRKDIVLFDGLVLQDGDVTRERAKKLIGESVPNDFFAETRSSYGCNMNIRPSLFDHIRFDPAFVDRALYADFGFARRAAKIGTIGRAHACRCVHLMVQLCRLSGFRYGFAQIANPVHLYRDGSITLSELVLYFCGRSTAANLLGLLNPDSIDRIGRLRGNFKAIMMAVSGRCTPQAPTNIL
jgi:hypothetical protein